MRAFAVVTAVLASGCVSLTPAGSRVAVFQAPLDGAAAQRTMPAGCSLVSSKPPMTMPELDLMGRKDPFRTERNEAGATGANVLLILSQMTLARRNGECPNASPITDCPGSFGAWYSVAIESYSCTDDALHSLSPSTQSPHVGIDDPAQPARWFATFSIIAFDPATGDLGVGVQSHAFTAGAAVPYAIPGIGAVATQAAANRLYGPKAIELLKQGLSPTDVVKRLTDDDPGRDTRQLAVIDASGRSAVYTGKHVIDRNFDATDFVHLGGYAGHITGRNFSVQGNTLASEDVLKNMARAYEHGSGTMAERLMDALDAGQAAGGDTRGMQSAGLLVVRPVPPGSNVVVDRIVDVRVDDAVDPFKELRRLLNIQLGVPRKLTDQSADLAKAGKFDEAIGLVQKALEIQPNSDVLHYALAQRYAQAGRPLQALVPLREAIRLHPNLARQAAVDPVFAKMQDLAEFKRLIKVG